MKNNYRFFYLCKWSEPLRFTSNEKTIQWICARTTFEMTNLLALHADHAAFIVRLVFDSLLKKGGGVKRNRVVPEQGRNMLLCLLPVLWTSCRDCQSELWKPVHYSLTFPRLCSYWLSIPVTNRSAGPLFQLFCLTRNVLFICKSNSPHSVKHNAEISSDMSLTSAGNTASMQETALSQAESLRLP